MTIESLETQRDAMNAQVNHYESLLIGISDHIKSCKKMHADILEKYTKSQTLLIKAMIDLEKTRLN